MKKFESHSKRLMWFFALLLPAVMAGCADSNGGPTPVPPSVTATFPARAVTNAPTNTSITATFSEGMDPTTVDSTTFTLRVFNTTGVTDLITGTVTLDPASNIAIFDPADDLQPSTAYSATITTGVKSLASGRAMEAEYNWSFTTGLMADNTAPAVISTSEYGTTGLKSGLTGLPINRASTATFNKTMNSATISSPATTFTVKESVSGLPVGGVVTYSGTTATFTPEGDLIQNTEYTSTISTAAKDLAGISITAPYIWSWQTAATEDNASPTLINAVPTDEAVDVPIDKKITATFSEPMKQSTIITTNFTVNETLTPFTNVPGTVSYDVQHNIATFSPQNNLKLDTDYTVLVTSGAKDLAGNALVVRAVGGVTSPNPWTFRTATIAVAPVPVTSGSINLNRAANFAIAATAGITNTPTAPTTKINGNVVLNPNATCNGVAVDNAGGFGLCGGSPPTINGTVQTITFPDTTTAQNITDDLKAAYLSITPPSGPPAAGSLGGGAPIAAGTTLGSETGSAPVLGDNLFIPGVYTSITSILITGDITLDAQGDPNAVFVFQSASTVGTADGSPLIHARILLINGAKASNVWWQAGTSATLGLYTEWQGNLLAGADITMKTAATSCGRMFAGAFTDGAFILDSNVISVPGNLSAPATCK